MSRWGTGARPHIRLAVLALVAMAALWAAICASRAEAAINLEEGTDTVTTSKFEWDFGDFGGNPELINVVKWRGSDGTLGGNIANAGGGGCGDPTEFWGQSYGNADGQGPGPVVAGSRGTWRARGSRSVEIDSTAPTPCSGDNPPVPVRTRYTFFDQGAAANKVRIERTFGFGPGSAEYGTQGVRAYVPRLPVGTYTEVLHPNGAGTAVVAEGLCGFPCISAPGDWNGTWIALHAPGSGSGMVILRDPADASPARLVRDYDSSSGANNSGISLDRPTGSWHASLTETEYLCFYDSASWAPDPEDASSLPPGCTPATVPINTVPPTASPGAGNPRQGETFTAKPGEWENAVGSFTYQWLRCDGDSDCVAIPGATGSSYTAGAGDVGSSLIVRVGATATGGETDSALSSVAGSISGHVWEGERGGTPAARAPVQVCKLAGSPCRSTITDDSGFYRVQVPVLGSYRATAYPPATSSALVKTREAIIRARAETEVTNADIVLPLPKPPPPGTEFGGAGARGTTEGVPIVHWQEPFTLRYEANCDAEVEAWVEFGNGSTLRLKPSSSEPVAGKPGRCVFLFGFAPLYPNHGAARMRIVAAAPRDPGEQEEHEEEVEEEEQQEEEDEESEEESEEEEPKNEEETPSEEEESEEEQETEEAEEEETEEEENEETIFPIYIDPSGVVLTTDGAPLAGATVTLLGGDSAAGPFTSVPDGSAVMSPLNRRNPDSSEADGQFGWDVIAGLYKVRVEKPGCNAPGAPAQAAVESDVLTIPPPVTDLELRLECPTASGSSSPGPAPGPPARVRMTLRLPGSVGTVKVAPSGAFAVKSAQLECPAASPGPCSVAVSVLASPPKAKKHGKRARAAAKAKPLKLGASKLTVAPGATAALTGKLSGAGLKKLTALGRLNATIELSGSVPAGDVTPATLAATLVPAKKPPQKHR